MLLCFTLLIIAQEGIAGPSGAQCKVRCIHCKRPINEWSNVSAPPAPILTTEQMVKLGKKAE